MTRQITISVNEKLCKQCGICVSLCPKQVLAQEPGRAPEVRNLGACTGCSLCQMRCPDFAIEVEAVQ